MDEMILKFFEGIRNPALTVFFSLFSVLGEAMIVGGIAILLYWLLPRRAGEQLLLTVLTSFSLNSFLKYRIARPRPFVDRVVTYREPAFLAKELDPYASFPSGHTQSSSSLLFGVSSVCRRKKIVAYILSSVLVLLVMTSRLYFGAHYPSDVLCGLLLGLFVALFWTVIYRFASGARYFVLLGLALLSLVPCLFPGASHDFFQAAGLLTGGAVSFLCLEFFLPQEEEVSFSRRLWRIPVGGAIAAAVYALTLLFPAGEAFTLLKWFLLAFTGIFGAPYAFEILQI